MTLPTISSTPIKILAVVLSIVVIIACKFYFKVDNTNPIEVAAEEVIKDETGCDISSIVNKI